MPPPETSVKPALAHLFGQAASEDSLSLAAIRERATLGLAHFAAMAQQELQQRDISMPPAISLISSPECKLILENSHPHAQEIRHWLDGNANLARYFKEVEVLYEIVRAAECVGETFPESSRFHIGLTSAGPIAYFEEYVATT